MIWMSSATCPVCNIPFSVEATDADQEIICPVCAAKLQFDGPPARSVLRRYPEEPAQEINGRAERFAQQRDFVFNEDRDLVVSGLLDKAKMHGDFFCPCRLENVPENICPCLDTRSGSVKRDGRCLCGLFWLPESDEQ